MRGIGWVMALAAVGCGRVAFAPIAATGDASGDDAGDALQTADASTLGVGLIAYYPLDDASFAAGAIDASGNNHPAQCTLCPITAAGRLASSALFDGTTLFTVPFATAFNTTTGLTVSAWAFPVDLTAARSIAAKPHSGSTTANSWQLEYQTATDIRFKLRSATQFDVSVIATGAAATGAWQHVAGTWDGTDAVLYVNGVERARVAISDVVFDTGDVFIGADFNNGATAEEHDGNLDDVRIYGRALTLAEIQSLASP